MKKLCLILTVLYAIWANCSAQSLNIARNLLEGNSSTFDSGWGSWDEQGNCCGRSLKPIGGPDGSQCARLTPKQASNDWDAQLKYNFAATQGTTYVFRLKAKKVSGDGKIKAIMQHNTGSYEQIAFFEKNVTGSWATYEGEVTADRTDYNVIVINYGKCGEVLIDDIEFGVKTDNVARTINVDGKTREYWLYVPASVKGQENVPVVFSLHGRGGTDDPNDDNSSKYGKPTFTSLADKEGFIVVYPQGRDGTNKADYPDDGNWNDGFVGTTGWEATGKENADTKFIKALVDKIQDDYKTRNNSNSNISVNPKKFYLCGFSMGGMMTYACAKVLNGTFAAYGSCSGYPLNEFHMNLATENPIPFIHLHGNKDNMLGIKHLNTIIENLLFRNGCDLSKQVINTGWSTTKENGEELNFKKYDFIGVEGVPVTTVTFDGLGHNIEASAPAYLWNFFKDKTTDMYKSDIEWKWDMPTINANITHSSSPSYYGWKHEVNSKNWSLTYGGGGKTECSIHNCSSADPNCTGNHNVYNSIQLTPGKHTLYAKMTSTSGESSVTLRNILTGAETVARKVIDNSGTHDHTNFNVLYEFEVGEGAEFSLELKFSDSNSACNLLEIHKGSYRPQGVKDESQDNASINLTDGKLAELTFENGNNAVDIYPLTSGYGTDLTSVDGNMKLYLKSRLGIKNGEIDNKAKYIVKDAVFGHSFQNIPDADIYDRYGASDYMRVVLGEKNSLSGHDGIDGIQKTGKVTIGFWVNGDLAVNRGLAYDEPSMFYIAGDTYKGPNPDQNNGEYNPHMFNITCSGGLTGYMNDGKFQYNSGTSSFGELCDTKSNADFYNKNFYKDCNWHYITYQMYDNLSRFNMYVDGEPTCLGGYATHNAGSLEECIQGLKSIVLGGANANNVEFGYDVAFAYDDIVIYNRVLSKREINTIIENKKYSPSVWHFDRNLENNIFCNRDLLNTNMWASSDGVYTLNTNFSSAAALTYDGITEIPAFKGLRFVTNGKQIQIDAKSGALRLSQGVKVVFSNLVEGTYVRMEYKDDNVNWNNPELKNVTISGNTPSPSQGCVRTLFKVGGTTSEETSITMPSDINIIRMEATNKNFAQIKFVDNNNEEVSVVTNPNNENPLPRKELYVNGVIDNTSYDFKYTSSSPHVASIDDQGNVTLHGIAGSTVITAELINDANKYDCDIYDQYAFEPSNRIFSSYEIVVTPDPNTSCRVEDNKEYTVGQTLYNGDKTVGVTLGGWTYNNGTYYGNTDSYTAKEPWEGHKFEKNADRNGYLANSRKTEEDVFHEFFNDAHATFSTNGSCAAKSEQLKVEGDNTYAATGNYSAPTNNTSVANKTPWLLPCRGSHIKIEPTDAGLISVYVMQEGCVSHDKEDEPIDVTVKKVYVADEKGEIVKEVVADTKSKVAAQMWKDDGRARAEYRWNDSRFAYNTATMNSFLKINDFNTQWSFLDNWPNPGMQQHVFKLGNDEDGHVLITKGIVRYTFNVLPGKTYYIFSNTAKLGLAGFTFKKGIHAEYHKVKPDAKHDEWRATGEFVDVSKVKDVVLEDGKDYSAPTDAANANVTLNRTFYKNRWNAICLPYSINRRQIEEVFGDGTMVVLMKNIDTSNKKVMFIEHANQDIIAGYPYLIFPTTKDDKGKTNHDPITGITTRATFGEADSPLFSVGTDGNTYPFTEPMQSDALVFKGTFTNATLNEGSYVVTNKGVLSRIPKDKDGMKIRPYRSYIYFNRQTAGAKAISLQSMNVNGFENDEDNTTGIENLLFESGILTHSADVYSIDGQLVRSKALNFNGLPKGVYIVNGKKYVKK
ncbi:dienelactone hydrolase family protein [Segatella hominis]|uniref:dienelactone hydrolase family protein n=3 Tax=Segatella hominis TaxID=2518605 RepID=UPI003AB86CAC